ncbi:hypothetical protein AX16_006116 [Volvariella volvacea WC 439]|nr:hypothetical protein AX16_006116 [Volvariella volvacea WC 439]
MPLNSIRKFIRRSQHALLTIYLHYMGADKNYWEGVISSLENTTNRITSLECIDALGVTSSGEWVSAYKLDLSTSPLKRLSALRCNRVYEHWEPSFRLRHLTITRGHLHPAFLSADLTILALGNLDLASLPPQAEFNKALSYMTKLHNLQLKQVLSALMSRTGQGEEPFIGNIPLPSLFSLKLCDSERICSDFLERCTFPTLENFDFVHDGKEDTSLSLLTKTLIDILPRTSILHFTSRNTRIHLTRRNRKGSIIFLFDNRFRPLSLRWISSTLATNNSVQNSLSSFSTIGGIRALVLDIDACIDFFNMALSCGCVNARNALNSSHQTVDPLHTLCQAPEASQPFFPGLVCLDIRVTVTNQLNLHLLRTFLDHRTQCGQRLREVTVHVDIKTTSEMQDLDSVMAFTGALNEMDDVTLVVGSFDEFNRKWSDFKDIQG